MTKILTNPQGKAYISSGGKALVGASNTTILNVTPSTSAQTFTPSSGVVGYDTVNVSAVTASIDQNIVASNIKKDVTILSVTGTYEGSTPSGIYQLLDRVIGEYDGRYKEVGTVVGFFTKNNVEYAVVCLDAVFRNSGIFSTSTAQIPNLPIYNNIYSSNIWGATETGTENTEIILNNFSSTILSNMYNNVQINAAGRVYHGVLPNIQEAVMIAKYYAQIENKDTSSGGVRFNEAKTLWTSNQLSYTSGSTTIYTMWTITDKGYANGNLRKNQRGGAVFCPILEFPNALS